MKILFLSTWFPYPPNQGSKTRALHLLRALARRHEIALVSFEDTEIAPEWRQEISRYCARIETLPRKPFAAKRLGTIKGWLSQKPSAVIAIQAPEMGTLVREVADQWKPDGVAALTFVTAPYALETGDIPKILDIDNIMARMLSEAVPMASSLPDRFRRWLAYQKFRRYEKELYPQFDLCLVVTENDRNSIQTWIPFTTDQVTVVPNGVDLEFFSYDSPNLEKNTLVFNGALTYNANYDAMDYFLREVFPQVVRQVPGVRLKITGSTQGVDLSRLPLNENVHFTGYLDDIRPAVAQSWGCVVPLRIGGGTRLKILEAMALGTPVISTSKGAEGLDVQDGRELLIADTPLAFSNQIVRLLNSPELRGELAGQALQLVKSNYSWDLIGERFADRVEKLFSKS